MSSIGDSEDYSSTQFSIFKDSLARRLLSLDLSSSPSTTTADDAAELDDFTTYLAHESWPSLPSPLRAASHETASSLITPDDIDADTLPLESTPPAFIESLVSYGYTVDSDASITFLRKTLKEYLVEACAAPPPWSATRTTECEICEREVPLTYHHLIPRSTHTKVLKKGWHKENMLGSVAWLCRACHSTVHRVATNDELARSYYTVDSLLEREDIQRWRRYAARQRFGIRWRSRGTDLPPE